MLRIEGNQKETGFSYTDVLRFSFTYVSKDEAPMSMFPGVLMKCGNFSGMVFELYVA